MAARLAVGFDGNPIGVLIAVQIGGLL